MYYCNTKRCKETHTHTHTQLAVKYGWHEVVEFTCSQPTKRRDTNSTTELINITRGSSKSIEILEEEPHKTIGIVVSVFCVCSRIPLCWSACVCVLVLFVCTKKGRKQYRVDLFVWMELVFLLYSIHIFGHEKRRYSLTHAHSMRDDFSCNLESVVWYSPSQIQVQPTFQGSVNFLCEERH